MKNHPFGAQYKAKTNALTD